LRPADSSLNDRSARMQVSKWEINVTDGCGVNSQGDCLSARFVTGSRVAGIDGGVVAVDVPAQKRVWYFVSGKEHELGNMTQHEQKKTTVMVGERQRRGSIRALEAFARRTA